MDITSTMITRTALQLTESLRFQIEYTIVDGKLQRVQFNIFKIQEDENTEQQYVGSAYMENGFYSCSVPLGEDIAGIFQNISEYMEAILEAVENEPNSAADKSEHTNR